MPDPLPATGSVSIGVAAPPAVVWRHVADPATPARFSAELAAAGFVDGDHAGVGAVIWGRNENGARTWETRSTVVACDAPSRFEWATGGAESPTATWTLAVEPADGGATLTHTVVLHAGRPPLAPAIEAAPDRAAAIVADRLASLLMNMAQVVAGIAQLSESDVA